MLKNLPQDVGNIIYNYLLFSESHGILFSLSKKTTNTINKFKKVKEYNKFINSVSLMRHDKFNSSLRKKDLNLSWEKHHLYKWPEVIFCETKKDTKPIYEVGEYVDVKDYVNAWCPAIIRKVNTTLVDINPDPCGNSVEQEVIRHYDVEFLGWTKRFNENVPINKITRLGKYTLNPRDKFGCLIKSSFEPFWSLLKGNDGIWRMERISSIAKNENTNSVLIIDNFNNDVEINENNVEKMLCCVTDATAFLCNALKTAIHKKDTFYF